MCFIAIIIDVLKRTEPPALTFRRAKAVQPGVKTYLMSSFLSQDVESAYTFSLILCGVQARVR